jgi:hypothetical protein
VSGNDPEHPRSKVELCDNCSARLDAR